MNKLSKPTHRKHHPLHDYRERCIYHITLVVSDRCQVLGRMVDCRNGYDLRKVVGADGRVGYVSADGRMLTEKQLAESARVEFTPLGRDIQRKIQEIPSQEARKGNDVQILAACVMPEHIHFVLFVRQPMAQKLGVVIRGFKQGCNKALRAYLGESGGRETALVRDGEMGGRETALKRDGEMGGCGAALRQGEVAGSQSGIASFLKNATPRIIEQHALFAEDFDETRLRRKGQLKAMIEYVHNNPSHRWLRMHKPEWLLPIRGIEIAGRKFDALGNVNLLALPRIQVHCRYRWERDNDTESRRAHQNDCVLKARNGYALVSPFISPHEVAVRDVCLREGHSIIQLQDNGFSDLAQCPGGLYDYCVNGQVLLLVPSDWPRIENKGKCSREECVVLNSLAESIVNEQ